MRRTPLFAILDGVAIVALVFGLTLLALGIVRDEEPILWVGAVSLLAGAIANQFIPLDVPEYDEVEADGPA